VEDRRDQHRREAALALGPVYSLVSELELVTENATEGWVPPGVAHEQFGTVADEWRRHKPAIMALGVSYPEARVREAAASLARDIDWAVLFGSHAVTAVAAAAEGATTPDDEETAANAAVAKLGSERAAKARKQLEELAAAIRGDRPKKRTPAEKAAEQKIEKVVQELEKVVREEPEG
jgi:hypothetical protein